MTRVIEISAPPISLMASIEALRARLVALVELGMHGLDHHNGVVDHNRDRKHESREGDEVDREADKVEHEECTDKGHRDGDGRDDGRADILQEDVHHKEHKDECLDKRLDHSVDRRIEEVVVVHRDFECTALGQIGFQTIYKRYTVVDNLGSVGAGSLEHHRHRRHLAVVLVRETVGHTAELDIGHVFEVEHLAVGAGADNDVAELLGLGQTAAVAHGVLERLVALLAECTGSGLDVLLGKRCRDVGRHQVILGHHVGLEPYTHRVVGAERHHVAHARTRWSSGMTLIFM